MRGGMVEEKVRPALRRVKPEAFNGKRRLRASPERTFSLDRQCFRADCGFMGAAAAILVLPPHIVDIAPANAAPVVLWKSSPRLDTSRAARVRRHTTECPGTALLCHRYIDTRPRRE